VAGAGVAAAEADLDVVADHLGILQEPLGGELVEATADDGGHFGLVGPKAFSRFRLGKLLFLDGNGDFGGELRLREGLFRLGHAYVGEDVPAALDDVVVLLAGLCLQDFSFALVRNSWSFFASFSRDLISSMSAFGVALPVFDYLENAH
jgi:hypothetical protein